MDTMHRRVASSADVDVGARVGCPPDSTAWWELDTRDYWPAVLEDGVVVGFGVSVAGGVDRETVIGRGTVVLPGAHIGHDTVVGIGCVIGKGAIVGGNCEIGDGARIGEGSVLAASINIGPGARTGVGAVVVCDVPAGEVWSGNPARAVGRRSVAVYARPPGS